MYFSSSSIIMLYLYYCFLHIIQLSQFKIRMKPKLHILLCCFLSLSLLSIASEKRALLIGIDKYYDSETERFAEWQNLDGAVNDASAVYDILRAKYGFNEKNMKLLAGEKNTTKKAIIKGFNQLIKSTKPGDQVFIYYAGHGAQITNSQFYELDKKNEAIVPSDVLRTNEYLLDVEINDLLNQILDKNGELTVIFDNCFSGSGTRGKININELKSRYVPVSDLDIDTKFEKKQSAAERGALVISAAQDYQFAKEYKDSRGQSHGVFTYALIKAMQASNVNESAEDVFKRVNSIILYNAVPRQDPVIEASAERIKAPLFGGVADPSIGVQIGVVDAENKYKITLDGGSALGIVPGTQLSHGEKGTVVEVTSLFGVNGSYCKIIEGDKELSEGDLLKVTKWAPYNKNRLKVNYSSAGINTTDLEKVKELSKYYRGKNLLADNPLEPTIELLIKKDDSDKWVALNQGNKDVFSDNVPTSSDVDKYIKSKNVTGKVFIEIPPSEGVYKEIEGALVGQAKVEKVGTNARCDYQLIGKYNQSNILEYAWLRTSATNKDDHSPLPEITDWLSKEKTVLLSDFALRLGEVKSWLTMDVPPNNACFPYKLGLMKESNGEIISQGALVEGEVYTVSLYLDEKLYDSWNNEDRYIYIFLLENDGSMQLLFPDRNASVENNTEQIAQEKGDYKSTIKLVEAGELAVSPPFTTDNILMLSTTSAIIDTSIFNQTGVRSRGSGEDASLESLLEEEDTRKTNSVSNWYLEKHTFYGEEVN
ncbi:hypothetical protein EI427_06240 [Flammeovirga pectinis]|uniref:Peptidase C14 caspase domain-containing protein n=2 Tax=Flammeovirga pectinis TaxID=2494373 RepID=A0A3S9P130_9BACT|nr:hypothetical protein EI427_06240 [Flammeovirga pectinis]